jgi:hypothetical protein
MPDTKARRMAKLKTPKRGEDKKGPAPARHIPWPEVNYTDSMYLLRGVNGVKCNTNVEFPDV